MATTNPHHARSPARGLSPTAAAMLLTLLLVGLHPGSVQAQDPGDPASGSTNSTAARGDSAAGAAGASSSALDISKGGTIAIILVAVLVGGGGIASAILFYIAKKRQWEVRENLRRSARRVTDALTPRRSTFPVSAGLRTRPHPPPPVRAHKPPATTRHAGRDAARSGKANDDVEKGAVDAVGPVRTTVTTISADGASSTHSAAEQPQAKRAKKLAWPLWGERTTRTTDGA
ncbi:MAG: hypothetical protein M1826_005740 [Phylliscum demangeonii]|nr:MAG: hypothetical protein M1826_005740 [Phylliscum demangeonii]